MLTEVSKLHAIVTVVDGLYYITDSHSSNGIRLNALNVAQDTPILLAHEDVISVGSISMTFKEPAAEAKEDQYFGIVKILPSEKKYEDTVTIRAEIEAEEVGFCKAADITDVDTLREDYEKLRLAYELSQISATVDVNLVLAKALDLMFEILPVVLAT